MVAFTTTDTLSLVITSWRSPVRGVSRMSTASMRSMNGTRNVTPGLRTEWNWPSRLTTPTRPCWMTRMVREITSRARTTISAAMIRGTYAGMASPSGVEPHCARRGLHDQGGPPDVDHPDGGAGGDRPPVAGQRRPVLPSDADVAAVVG